MNQPVLRAAPLRTRVLVVSAWLAAGSVVLALSELWFFPWLKQYFASANKTNIHERLQYFFAGLAIFILAFAGFIGYLGVRAVVTQRWPLPGTFVVRDTPIRTGTPAVARGVALLALSLCALALAIVAALIPGMLLHP